MTEKSKIIRSLIIITILLSNILGLTKESFPTTLDVTQKLEQIKNTIANLPKDFSNNTVENLISSCNDIINLDSKNTDAHIYLAVCYYFKRDIDRGIEILNKSLSLDSNNSNIYFLRGYGYYGKAIKMIKEEKISCLNKAILDFDKSLSLNPNYESIKVQKETVEITEVMFYIGLCYKEKGDILKAKETFQKIIDKYPNGDWTPEAKSELEHIK